MKKIIYVVVSLKSKHYSDEYIKDLKSYLEEAGLELSEESTVPKTKIYLDYDAQYMIDDWSDFISSIEEKFPTVKEIEFEDGYGEGDESDIVIGPSYSKLSA